MKREIPDLINFSGCAEKESERQLRKLRRVVHESCQKRKLDMEIQLKDGKRQRMSQVPCDASSESPESHGTEIPTALPMKSAELSERERRLVQAAYSLGQESVVKELLQQAEDVLKSFKENITKEVSNRFLNAYDMHMEWFSLQDRLLHLPHQTSF